MISKNFKKEILNLIKISRKIGNFPDYVQGGGGNTSVKITNSLMAIKASGYFLKNISLKTGISFVNFKKIKSFINKKKNTSEEDLTSAINNQQLNIKNFRYLKPSIETGFHAIYPKKFIIHSHIVYANILLCSTQGQKILNKI